MRSLLRMVFLIIIQMIVSGQLNSIFSQKDSVSICFSQEEVDSSFDYNKQLKYRHLDINLNLKDETWLFKIGLPGFGISSYKGPKGVEYENIGFSLTFEKKISQSVSFLIQNSNSFKKSKSSADSIFYNSSLDYGIRYYFLMKKRIREGISGNNCSGVYLDFFIMNLNMFEYQKYKISFQNFYDSRVIKYYNYSHLLNKSPTFSFNLGVQKRLNNFSFIDAKIFVQYTPDGTYERQVLTEFSDYAFKVVKKKFPTDSYYRFGLDFIIGLAWGMK
jgi:hypothetical protein